VADFGTADSHTKPSENPSFVSATTRTKKSFACAKIFLENSPDSLFSWLSWKNGLVSAAAMAGAAPGRHFCFYPLESGTPLQCS
jgi:hypothetical protein